MKNNPRITAKERGLIKGAIRRAFSRSELRNSVLISAIIQHSDSERPKVKTWVKCAACLRPEAKSYMVVDHLVPVIPVESSMEEMSADDLINNVWCELNNLQVLCPACHSVKTKAENALRRKYKKENKNGKRSSS